MQHESRERQMNLAIRAIRQDPKISIRAAAWDYNVDWSTLAQRKRGRRSRRDISANSRKLNELEENSIVQYILSLDVRGFPPQLTDVADMANLLLAERDATRVGQNWASNFVKRHSELGTRLSRKYDYQRAKCEDPEVIRGWFALVQHTIAKYGIQEADIYNFDETGFVMGQISTTTVVTSADRRGKAKSMQPGNREWVTVIQGINSQGRTILPFIIFAGKVHLSSWYKDSPLPEDWIISVTETGWTTNEKALEWIQHFNKYTERRRTGGYRLLILDGHESHHSAGFELYCKENGIIALYASSFISHPPATRCWMFRSP